MTAALEPKRISIRGDRWRMNVNLDVFMVQADAQDIKALFKNMLICACENQEAYAGVDQWLKESIDRAEKEWYQRSQAYVNGWKDTSVMPGGSKALIAERARAREVNEDLKSDLSKAKRLVDKLKRDYEIFHEHVEKYRVTYY